MPEATDPQNARLALRRLVATLIRSNPERRPDGEATIGDTLDLLDADEMADFEQVIDALRVLEPARFARHGREVLDLRHARDPHAGDPEAFYLFTAPDQTIAAAVVRMLNRNPEAWDEALASGEEPF